MWREEGLAHYLSNLVYPNNNREWGEAPERRSTLKILAENELGSTVLQRAYTNFIFFQYLGNRLGDEGLFALVRSLPTGPSTGPVEQATRLAAYPNMNDIYQDFAKDMTDKKILDTSTQVIPYELSEENRPTADLNGPHLIKRGFDRFSVSRRLLTIPDKKRADLTYTPKGNVREDARPESGGDWRTIPSELPVPECIQQVIVVVTTIEPNTGYELEVPEVEDTEAACGIVGTWVVDNGSLRFRPEPFMLDDVAGRISITFRSDGSAEVVYSGFEYKVYKDTDLDVGGEMIRRHEEFTYTTNATGVTSYQVEGNAIQFGHLFESDYLVGTETVRQIRQFTPEHVIGDNSDEVTTRDPRGRDLFSGYWEFDLQSGGGVMHFLNGDDIWVVLHRSGSADQ
jgi:hypothetical protein